MARRRTRRTSSSASTTKRTRRSTSTSLKPIGRAYLTDAMIDSIVKEIHDRLALGDIGLKVDELREVLQPVIESIADQYSSRPSKEQIIARILRAQDKLLELISMYLVETREELTESQLEFVIYNGGTGIARHAPRLYEVARRLGREDLIDILQARWLESGLATPFQCPYCGFYSLTPDLTCIVCGREVDEKEYKKYIGFDELLKDFARSASKAELMEVLSERRVAYDGQQLLTPSSAAKGLVIIFHLDEHDIKLLRGFVERGEHAQEGKG